MTIEKYPLDFESLKKGMTITAAQIQKICGHQPGTQEYEFYILTLRKQIMEYKKLHGDPVTVNTCSGCINILTDSEAAIYNDNDFNRRKNGMLRAYGRQRNVDSTQLTTEERKAWERSLIVQSYTVSAIHEAKKRIRIEAQSRNTPCLVENTE